jgi:predicted pyridoxine 5'-phosphate oxidase superfamily flavin-nucleotide-binding protein
LCHLPNELRELVESGPLAQMSTINQDGSPQVTVIWIGLDDDAIVSGHMHHHKKLKNIERDARVVLEFRAWERPRRHDADDSPGRPSQGSSAVGEWCCDLVVRVGSVN